MMDFVRISQLSQDILKFLESSPIKLKPEEKMAALDAARSTITSVISAESMQLFYANLITKGFK